MPAFVREVTFIIISPEKYRGRPLGTYDEIMAGNEGGGACWPDLPYQKYLIYAPVIGEVWHHLGKRKESSYVKQKSQEITDTILYQSVDEIRKSELLNIIKDNAELEDILIEEFYLKIKENIAIICSKLSISYQSWDENKKAILEHYKPIFSELVAYGVEYHHLRLIGYKSYIFVELLEYALDGNALTKGLLAKALLNKDPNSPGGFKEMVNLCVHKGADINAVMGCNPDYGSYLHYHAASEYTRMTELFDFVELQRDPTRPNTQFCYDSIDGYGNPLPVILAATRKHTSLRALLALQDMGINVGVNLADKYGRTALLISAAVGLKELFVELLEKRGANPLKTDEKGLGIYDYVKFDRKALSEMLKSDWLDPDRFEFWEENGLCQHTNLYAMSTIFPPLCLFPDEETANNTTGEDQKKYLMVLSRLEEHITKFQGLLHVLRSNIKNNYRVEWSKQQLAFAMQQISYVQKAPLPFVQLCRDGQREILKYLETEPAKSAIAKYKERADVPQEVTHQNAVCSPQNSPSLASPIAEEKVDKFSLLYSISHTLAGQWRKPDVKTGPYAGHNVACLTLDKGKEAEAAVLVETLKKAQFSVNDRPAKNGKPCITVDLTESNPVPLTTAQR